jgi:hypothetical protein
MAAAAAAPIRQPTVQTRGCGGRTALAAARAAKSGDGATASIRARSASTPDSSRRCSSNTSPQAAQPERWAAAGGASGAPQA